MASGVSTSPINVLDRLKNLLSVFPGLIEEFDRNLFNTHDEVILQCMERRVTELCSILFSIKFFDKSRKDREQVFQSVKDVYR